MIEPWLKRCLPESGRLALDIGANVGTWSEWLCERFLEVHAFEPNPQVFPTLRLGEPNFAAIPAAVGARSGLLKLRLYERTVHASLRDRDELDAQGGGQQRGAAWAPVLSLDDAGYAGRPVDFAKIDTEGYEAHVLHGARRTIGANRPELLIEVHAELIGDVCVELLKTHRYTVERIPHPHRGVPAGHHWLHAKP